jgi:hypothetical protein
VLGVGYALNAVPADIVYPGHEDCADIPHGTKDPVWLPKVGQLEGALGSVLDVLGPALRPSSHRGIYYLNVLFAVVGSELVLYEVEAGVATVTLNNPERKNAWSVDMENAYFDLLDRAAADDAVRAIVLTGAGGAFCPGLDTSKLASSAGGGGLNLAGRRPQHYPLTIPKPMIAAINGACAGIGMVPAAVCDARFVARGARLSTAYARRGLPAEYGLSWLLPKLVGVERDSLPAAVGSHLRR